MTDQLESSDRREFFRRLARIASLGLLGGGAAILASRSDGNGQVCINKSVCCNCRAFDGCGLPAALSAKQAQGDSEAPTGRVAKAQANGLGPLPTDIKALKGRVSEQQDD